MTQTVLYRLYGPQGRLLYVGISHDLGARFVSHSVTKPWFGGVELVRLERYIERYQAEMAEKMAIRDENPIHNVIRAHARTSTPRPTGRPPSENPRTEIRRVRLTPDEDATLVAAAELAGKNLADWMRDKLLAAAKRQGRTRRS